MTLYGPDWCRRDKSNANGDNSLYFSVDPAPPEELTDPSDDTRHFPHNVSLHHLEYNQRKKVEQLRQQLLNTNLSIFKRYRALFALRNLGTPDAVKVHIRYNILSKNRTFVLQM
jgi:deoxyhypusine monooxygenase